MIFLKLLLTIRALINVEFPPLKMTKSGLTPRGDRDKDQDEKNCCLHGEMSGKVWLLLCKEGQF